MRGLEPLWRGLRVTEHVLTGAAITAAAAVWRALGRDCGWLPGVVAWWHRRLCRGLALRIEVRGDPGAPALLVANHVSWLDIPVIGGCGPITFLSKAEVRSWPLVGWMSSVAGTLFMRRGAHEAGAITAQIAGQIQSGRSVVIFPEGTTSDGKGLLRFHPRLFAVAQQAGVPVRPVALRYGSNESPDTVAPFIGDDMLMPHLLRVLRSPGIRVQISFLPELDARQRDRRGFADAARAELSAALGIAGTPAAQMGPRRHSGPPHRTAASR
jgi:1-acyl-sn-glycerol-3-phosphate acyltransferase